ncbi:MAG: SDR family oxidoreductase [Candidatus Binatus sp.]|uniref:SDR family NAD(P)-dependent oxidoreductase n=1 Tax=Candidatus Binatus sp. TaxID=2811406 RepID=UPI003C7382FC
MKQLIDLHGRRALITGGGRGIGRSMALALADAGAEVAVASRSQGELDAVASEIKERGQRGFAVIIDVMSREQIVAGVDEAARKLGGLDILINNAGGVIAENPLHLDPLNHDPRAFEDNLFMNLTQAFYATHAALPYMIKQKWGRIISIGSGYAKNGGGPLAYSAAKHGLIGFTRSLAYAAAPHGINVNVLCPGWTNTRMVDWNVLGAMMGVSAADAKRFAESQNIQKRIVEPDELGAMAALLASDAASAVTGQVISVDGGFMI